MTVLIRHAESLWNRQFGAYRIDAGILDPGLTPEGRVQAEAIAASLEGTRITRIMASPYRRALETASILAQDLGLRVELQPLVRERCAFSCDLGSQPEDLQREWPGIDFSGLERTWWGGMIESFDRLNERAERFREELKAVPDRATLAIVSHWGFIRALTGLEVHNATLIRLEGDALTAVLHEGRRG